jgi:hypothetical protein
VFFDAALRFIERHREEPFFVYLPTNAPHTPLEVAPEYSRPYLEAGLDETTARVYGMVTNIDENFGRLLSKLDELDLRRRTVVLFLGDNGPQQPRYNAGLRGRKGSTYEGGLRAPAFLQWPERLPGGRTIDTIVADIDVLPTLLELCGIAPPDDLALDGTSLVPVLNEAAADPPDRRLFFQCHRGLTPKRYQNCAVVTQRYKLVGFPGTFSREDLDTTGEPVFELYDLVDDPEEQRNLAERRSEIVAELRRAYDAWFDDVRATRNFTPGVIHIGTDAENPVRLCRYQDADFRDGRPRGWGVEIVHGGEYELTIERGEHSGPGRLFVSWQGETITRPLEQDGRTASITLDAGRGVLDAWFQEGRERVFFTENNPLGDVTVRRQD